LPLLKGQLILLVLVLSSGRQIILPDHRFLHVLEQNRYRRLVIVNLPFILGLLFLEAFHEFVDFTLFLVEDLVLLSLTIFSAGSGWPTAS
jgi:hypothetical protein